jgi:peptide deformylase
VTNAGDREAVTDERAAGDAFIAELRRWREVCGLSQKRLAGDMGYDPSYVSKIESGQQQPTRDFAARADQVLQAGGSITRRWREYASARSGRGRSRPSVHDGPPDAGALAPGNLIVCHEQAELSYSDGTYHVRMRRQLHNASDAPVTRFLIRIAIDRHPGQAERSNDLYRHQPLTWEELHLAAESDGEPMAWQVKHDRDAFKEIWLLFENDQCKFPLYPGDTTWIEYSYSVSAAKYGQWFQRAVRAPTERLAVQITLPTQLDHALWGMETTMTADAMPVRTPIHRRQVDDQVVFEWSTENPPLHARYRFEWRFRADDRAHDEPSPPSQRMRRLGVIQDGDPVLRTPAEPFKLPEEAAIARGLGELLIAYLAPIRAAHSFGKGMGLAAPQIGVSRAAAVVKTPDGEPVVLYNARVIDASAEQDNQYEGCLSFFDVRGVVPRPLRIDVEHTTLDGELRVTTFERGAARLWAHEIDHLAGVLYTDLMPAGAEPLPVERYDGTGSDWTY